MSWAIDLKGTLGSFELDMSLDIEDGLVVLVGPNGSGKSTLLRAIAGAELGLEGRISLNGKVLVDSAQGLRVPPHLRRIGYVPQGYALFPHLTAVENVAFGCGTGDAALEQAAALLSRFEIGHLQHRYPAVLSGGEGQQVALARAVAIDPEALLLDEPLAALDPRIRRAVRTRLARHLRDSGVPAIVVTHDRRDVKAMGGTVVVVEDGAVVQTGTADDLSANPSCEFVAEFFVD